MPRYFCKHIRVEQNLNSQNGVTLVELMVYMVISGMLLAMAATAFLGQNKSYNRQEVIAEIQQNIRGATEQMSSDIRFAGIGLLETSKDPFMTADTGRLAINYWADLGDYWAHESDYWGDLEGEQKTVHYELNGTNLRRAYTKIENLPRAGDWRVIAENIEYFRLEYQLGNSGVWKWQGTVDIDELDTIRAIKIMILGSARSSAFNQTDPATYNFPLDEVGATLSYTPVAGTGYKRLMSTVVQSRNNRD